MYLKLNKTEIDKAFKLLSSLDDTHKENNFKRVLKDVISAIEDIKIDFNEHRELQNFNTKKEDIENLITKINILELFDIDKKSEKEFIQLIEFCNKCKSSFGTDLKLLHISSFLNTKNKVMFEDINSKALLSNSDVLEIYISFNSRTVELSKIKYLLINEIEDDFKKLFDFVDNELNIEVILEKQVLKGIFLSNVNTLLSDYRKLHKKQYLEYIKEDDLIKELICDFFETLEKEIKTKNNIEKDKRLK